MLLGLLLHVLGYTLWLLGPRVLPTARTKLVSCHIRAMLLVVCALPTPQPTRIHTTRIKLGQAGVAAMGTRYTYY